MNPTTHVADDWSLVVSQRMKIRVQHRDGKTEILDLVGDWTVVEGEHLNRLQNGGGVEYFFTADGFYDGWGRAIPPTDRESADTS